MLGDRIRNLRKEQRITQSELGKVINVSKVSVSGYENGTREPDTDSLIKLANYFNVTVDYLLGTTTSKKGKTPENATDSDLKDLKNFMEHNDGSMTYGGEELTETEKEQLKFAMETVFWKRQKAKKNLNNNNKE